MPPKGDKHPHRNHSHHVHDHDHAQGQHKESENKEAASRRSRIVFLGSLTSIIFLAELIVGYATGSIALVSDSFHMLSDVLALVIGWYAIKLTERTNYDAKFTYGFQRSEIIGALTNGVFLVALCFTLFIEAIQRLVQPEEIGNPLLVLIVGIVGLVNNLIGMIMFHDHGHSHAHNHGQSHGDSHGHKHDQKQDYEHSSKDHRHKDDVKTLRGPTDSIRPLSTATEKGVSSLLSNPTLIYGAQTRAAVLATARSIDERPFTDSQARMTEHAAQSSAPFLSTTADDSNGVLKVVVDARIDGNETLDDLHNAVMTSQRSHHSHHSHHEPDLEYGSTKERSSAPKEGDLNMKSIFLHVAGDALGSVGVIVSALISMFATGSWTRYADPVVSLMITGIILHSAIPVVRSASYILLQVAPVFIPIDLVKKEINEVPGVLAVHEFHVWGLSDSKAVASVHLLVSEDSF
ncbi:cation efflux protein, partial [Chytridium lagenaria]